MNIAYRNRFIKLLFAMAALFYSCNDSEPKVCGCKSNETERISDSYCSVLIVDDAPVLICLDKGYVTLCDTVVSLNDGDILHEVNGSVQSSCTLNLDTAYAFNETYIYKASYFKPHSFNKYTQPLLNNPITWKHFKIEIIRSEDYGYPVGFGYTIINYNTEFTLVQPILPVEGFVPCKSALDAIKAAFLRVSKMQRFKTDFVEMYPEELQFIGVYEP